MSKQVENAGVNLTRKRIYMMSQEDVLETIEPQQETADAIELFETDSAAGAMFFDAVETAAESYQHEKEEKREIMRGSELFHQDNPEVLELQKPQIVRKLTAMETAAIEFAAENKASEAVAAITFGAVYEHGSEDESFRSAMVSVHTFSAMSAAAGLIPLPLVDMAGFMTIQLLMLKKLSKLYKIPFDSQRSKSAIAILVSGINCGYLAASSSKLIPFIGGLSIAAMPVVNGAISYAVGRVFIKHFASGGTFLDFDPLKVRGYFNEQFREWKQNKPGRYSRNTVR